jgi:hypothetical protein
VLFFRGLAGVKVGFIAYLHFDVEKYCNIFRLPHSSDDEITPICQEIFAVKFKCH